MDITLKIWRQSGPDAPGQFQTLAASDISENASFLEMLDEVNERLIPEGKEPIAFDHDCREGICGACSLVINGIPHGPEAETTTCQLYMRMFKNGANITVEPYRCRPFPIVKDLIVDRSAFDTILQAGGYISVRTGSAPDANAAPVPKEAADKAMDAAACIGCGACVAACPNASAMLFTAAKLTHLNQLPQGKPEQGRRTLHMVAAMDQAGFGNCTNVGECEAVCPQAISLDVIAAMNRDYARAKIRQFLNRKR